MPKRESQFQADLIRELKDIFPGCIVLKNDPNYIQGFPDLLILFGDRWAALEVKAYEGAPLQPNQDYYLELLDNMAYAAIVYPENKEGVLNDLQQALATRRTTRISRTKRSSVD